MTVKAQNKETHELNCFITQNPTLTARVHPLVVSTVLDAYARRPADEKRAVGEENSESY